jgi:hypothetical protein
MLLNLKTDKRPLKVLTTFLIISSCGYKPVNFSPNFYAGDYINSRIINEAGEVVSCSEPIFNEYVSTHYLKVKEIADILSVARVPRWYKSERDKLVDELRKAEYFTEESLD